MRSIILYLAGTLLMIGGVLAAVIFGWAGLWIPALWAAALALAGLITAGEVRNNCGLD